ncbi:MAG: hypothetical protein RLZZ502_1933, partial [Pseudomonadota bacterium]
SPSDVYLRSAQGVVGTLSLQSQQIELATAPLLPRISLGQLSLNTQADGNYQLNLSGKVLNINANGQYQLHQVLKGDIKANITVADNPPPLATMLLQQLNLRSGQSLSVAHRF